MRGQHLVAALLSTIAGTLTLSLTACETILASIAGPPTVIATNPISGQSDVALHSVISVTFDRPIDPTSCNQQTFLLFDPTGPIEGTVSCDPSGRSAVFTPAQALALETTYTATVDAAVTDTRGQRLGTPITWTFTTRPGKWGSPQAIGRRQDSDAWAPIIACNQSGNVIVLWEENEDSTRRIWANHYLPGGGWQRPTRVQNPDAAGSENKKLVIDHTGRALAIWEENQYASPQQYLMSSRYLPDRGWQTPIPVEDNPDKVVSSSRLELDAGGNAIVLWRQSGLSPDGIPSAIWTSRFDTSNGWSEPEPLSNPAHYADHPALSVQPDGHALAIWCEVSDNTQQLCASRYLPTAGWQPPDQIVTGQTEPLGYVQLAQNAPGCALAVWHNAALLWSSQFNPDVGWSTPTIVDSQMNTDRGGTLVMDADGVATLLWIDKRYGGNRIWAARHDPHAGWSKPRVIDGGIGGESAHLLADRLGNVLAVWNRTIYANYVKLYASRYDPTSGWNTPTLVSSYGSDARWTLDIRGNALFAWAANQFEGAGEPSASVELPETLQPGVWVRAYLLADGWTTAQRLNTDTSRPIYVVGLTVDASRRATVVWSQGGQIYAARFE